MRTSARMVPVAVLGALVLGLTACGAPASGPDPQPPASAEPSSTGAGASASAAPKVDAASPLEGADWTTVTGYRCPAEDQKVLVDQVIYGDITGDGVSDAVVSLTCSTTTSSNPLRVEAFDGSSSPTHPRSLGVLISDRDPIYLEKADVTIAHPTVTVSGEALGPDAPLAAGPHVRLTQSFTYRDHTLRPGTRHTSG
ncbi:MAG: Transrane protease, serine 13 [Pseudonocardia sp.]|nr:Transrane protease, serine 13 [Pseudonocardia sp.]